MDPEIVDQMRALGDCLRRAALTFAFTALREGAARSDTLAAADHAALVPFTRRNPVLRGVRPAIRRPPRR
jgi:hypothetical protein